METHTPIYDAHKTDHGCSGTCSQQDHGVQLCDLRSMPVVCPNCFTNLDEPSQWHNWYERGAALQSSRLIAKGCSTVGSMLFQFTAIGTSEHAACSNCCLADEF